MGTPVCEMLGIDQPIVQAPMAAVPRLAAAVSDAGALGMVTLTWSDDAGAVVGETAALTGRPFGGNFILTSDHHRRLDQALEAGLRIVSFMWGDPSGYIEPVHAAGGIVLHTVGSAEEARRAVGSGVDVVVAQGWEAGGHVWGRVATLPLVPAVVDAVAPVPVIAAGGIGDARGVAAVLALGAQAAWLGTRFLLAEEMPIHEDYRRAADRRGRDRPAVVRQPVRRRVARCSPPRAAQLNGQRVGGRGPPPRRPAARTGDVIAHFASGEAIVRYEPAPPMTGTTGEIEALSMWAGQGVALARQPSQRRTSWPSSPPACNPGRRRSPRGRRRFCSRPATGTSDWPGRRSAVHAESDSQPRPGDAGMPSQAMQDVIEALRDRRKASASQAPPAPEERRAAFAPAGRRPGLGRNIMPGNPYRPASGLHQRGQHVHRRRLTRPIRAEQGKTVPARTSRSMPSSTTLSPYAFRSPETTIAELELDQLGGLQQLTRKGDVGDPHRGDAPPGESVPHPKIAPRPTGGSFRAHYRYDPR